MRGRRPNDSGPAAESIAYALVGAADATARLMNIVWLGLERYLVGEHWHKPTAAE